MFRELVDLRSRPPAHKNNNMASSTLPPTMKACVAMGFGEIEDNIFVKTDVATPTLDPTADAGFMLVRVLCCAVAPGDVRVLSGQTRYVQTPSGGHPYIPGSDTAGIVVAVTKDETKFQVGDYVVSRFELPGPVGGLAEYRKVKTSLSEKCPIQISPKEACGLTASALSAKQMVRDFVKAGDRVLVIGASGGVGTSVLQYAKQKNPSFIVAVSTQTDLCQRLGADRVIDYRTSKWWDIPEFQDKRFDVVMDLVGGDNWKAGGCSGKAINCKGTYVMLPPGVETEIIVRSPLDLVKVSCWWIFGLMLYSRLHPGIPRCVIPDTLDAVKDGDLKELLDDVTKGRLEPILDPASPLDFTEAGVRSEFAIQKSCHAHGKVVIKISDS